MGFKMKKDLWGLYHSAESATRQGNSSATPITQKSSPFKMNADLVQGAGMVGMSSGFNDLAASYVPAEKSSISEKKDKAKEGQKKPAFTPPVIDDPNAADLDKESEENSEL